LKGLRKSRGLTQSELARPFYTHAYISAIEAGKRVPSDKAIRHFATKLGVHPDELRTGQPQSLLPHLNLMVHEARLWTSAGRQAEAEEQFRHVARKAASFDLGRVEALAREGLGLILERRNDLGGAIDQYEMAAKLLESEPLHVKADVVAGKARCFHLLGEKTHAIYVLETYLHALEQEGLPDPDALIRIYTSLVITYVVAGFLRQASAAADKALALEERVQDPRRLGAMHNMVANALLERGDTTQAEESLRKAEHFYRVAELHLELGRARLARGIYYRLTGNTKKARADLVAAREIFQVTNSPLDEARACNEMAALQRSTQPAKALALLERASELIGDSDPGEQGRTTREHGLLLAPTDTRAAASKLREAVDLFIRAEERVEATLTYGHLGDLLASNSSGKAAEMYRAGIELLKTPA
jgi:transcriptional regulator with XRE-family HTH domain